MTDARAEPASIPTIYATRPMTQKRAKKAATKRKPPEHIDRAELDSLLGFQLRMAYVAVSRHFAATLNDTDLTQKQAGVLWLLGANPGVSQIALAKQLDMDRASMMAIIDRLKSRGLALRERSPHDGRRQELYLTPKGRKVLKQSKAALAEHEDFFKGRFSEAELAMLFESLRRLQH